ncbi:MAG TPA: hypothetical protein VN758_14420 [Solirubrobacterales bacterium]|nr:hypothetical protein [Solirubrobacterales bacterium]
MLEQGGTLTGIAAAREGLAALRAYAWLVVGLAILGLAIGYLTSASEDESKYRVWVTAQALGTNDSVTDIGITTPDGPQAADFLGAGIVSRLESSTGHDYDYLIDHLGLSQPPDGGPNPPIALIASADSETAARALLLNWMKAVHEARLHYVNGVLIRGERGLQKSLARASVRNEPATQRAIADLLARTQALRATLSIDYAIHRAPKSFEEATVSRPRAAAIGGVAGVIAGLALALLISLLGGRLRTAEGVEAALGIKLLTDLRSSGGIPSPEHARERLRAIGNGQLPSLLLLLPCGSVTVDAAAKLSGSLGQGTEVRVTEPPGSSGLLAELEQADAYAIVASPGAVRRSEVAALGAELDGVGIAPAGLIVV